MVKQVEQLLADGCRSGGYNGGYYRSPVSTFINVSDLFYFWDPYYSRRRGMHTSRPEGMTFFESIFSFGELPAIQDSEPLTSTAVPLCPAALTCQHTLSVAPCLQFLAMVTPTQPTTTSAGSRWGLLVRPLCTASLPCVCCYSALYGQGSPHVSPVPVSSEGPPLSCRPCRLASSSRARAAR